MLRISNPELRALVSGESIVAFVPRGTLTEGDEVELAGSGPRPAEDLKPAYRRWAGVAAPDGCSAVVVALTPAAVFDASAGSGRHVLAAPGDGDVVLLRVFRDDQPVLSDGAFTARRTSVQGALGT
jgi:hypothetical protein